MNKKQIAIDYVISSIIDSDLIKSLIEKNYNIKFNKCTLFCRSQRHMNSSKKAKDS